MTASANLDLVRSIYAAWERGDFSATEWAHPEIEYVVADGPSPGAWKGLGGLREGWRDQASVWDEFRAKPEEYQELDGERVLALSRRRDERDRCRAATDKGRGPVPDPRGKGDEARRLLDRDRALADLGLAAEGDAS